MDSLIILIPAALIFVFVAIRAFLWAVDSHQYEDLDTAAESILFDDVVVKPAERDTERLKTKIVSARGTTTENQRHDDG